MYFNIIVVDVVGNCVHSFPSIDNVSTVGRAGTAFLMSMLPMLGLVCPMNYTKSSCRRMHRLMDYEYFPYLLYIHPNLYPFSLMRFQL